MSKNTKITLGIVGAVIVGGVIAFLQVTSNPSHNAATQNGYCTPEGLSGTQPIQSHRSFCLVSSASSTQYQPNTTSTYSFRIVDDMGNTVKDFAVTHTKIMHVIVVRKDLSEFQHVHPDFNATTGEFTLPDLVFPSDGEYRIFADFAPTSAPMGPDGILLAVTLDEDVQVGDMAKYVPQQIGSGERTNTFDGYAVTLATAPQELVAGQMAHLEFTIEQNGKKVTDLEQYLGALGHSVILKEGTLDFLHVHPLEQTAQSGTVTFMATFPEAGKYKVFTQFQRAGKVFTTDFVVSVKAGAAIPAHTMPDGSMMMDGMMGEHMMH